MNRVDILIIRNRCDTATEYTNWVGEGLTVHLRDRQMSVVDLSDSEANPENVVNWLNFNPGNTRKAIIALDHGSNSAFYGEKGGLLVPVIDKSNAEHLTKGLHVYTLACSTNANGGLGDTAVSKGCFSWVGYIEPVYATQTESFRECIWSYVLAIADGKTIEQCTEILRKAYRDRVNESFIYQYNLDRLLLRKSVSNSTIFTFNRDLQETILGITACNGMFVCSENNGSSPLISNRTWVGEWETFSLVELGKGKVALRATNGLFVTAESGGSQPLIANRAWIRGWETFEYIDQGNNQFALRACNGKYVCAENNGASALIANRNAIGPWETFQRRPLRTIGFKACNKKFVCAETNGSMPLIANRDWHREWETFTFVELDSDHVAIRACNGKFVCAEDNGLNPLIANRDWIRSWETFDYVDLGNNRFALKACNGKFVCAENNGASSLIANRSSQGEWETFTVG